MQQYGIIKKNQIIIFIDMSRYYFNNKTYQKILPLKNNVRTAFYKSLSNIFYPFGFVDSKKWFQNVSQSAYIVSFFETILIWIFMIGFLKAIWNRIKF